MKRAHIGATLAATLAVVALLWGAGCSDKKKKAGCTKDTDCKGERVCSKGTCVGPEGQAKSAKTPDRPDKAATAKAGAPSSPTPGGSFGTVPAPGVTPPGVPPGPPGSGTWKADSIRLCLDNRCVGLGRGFGSNTQDLRAMLQMLNQLMFSGLGGGGQLPKLQVCVGPQCVKVDKGLLTNPLPLLRLLSNINPQMLRDLFQGLLSPRHQAQPSTPSRPGAPSAPPTTPPTGQLLRSFSALLQAGDMARGRTAELPKLTITSVSDNRLVLEGPGQEMIVLRIPTALKTHLPNLRITTRPITVRFRVLSRPIGKLVHGELLSYT